MIRGTVERRRSAPASCGAQQLAGAANLPLEEEGMRRLWGGTGVAVVVAALLMGTACATKKFVTQEVGQQAERIQGVESAVEENQRRIREVDGHVGEVDQKASQAQATGSQALEKGTAAFAAAEEAKKLAQGTLVLEATLTNDATRFHVDKWDLPAGGVPEIDALVQKILSLNKRVYLEIQGHTDSSGSESWNQELGERRAESVRRYLNGKGIPLYAMSVISFGSAQPVGDNKTRDGRAQNRRVVIRVLE
jgi:peptidoglycan-associated lipoprotein